MSNNTEELASYEIAVLVPCLNEEPTINKVINDFKIALPSARIYVYDNDSKDHTSDIAREAGAIVRTELLKGKGNVVRRMFADIEADIYVLVDGDDTYSADYAPRMVSHLVNEHLDMVNGVRIANDQSSFRLGHLMGNRILSGTSPVSIYSTNIGIAKRIETIASINDISENN